MIGFIKKYIRKKQNAKLYNELEPIIFDFIKNSYRRCIVDIINNKICVKHNDLTYHNKLLNFELVYEKTRDVFNESYFLLYITYDNKKLFKKCPNDMHRQSKKTWRYISMMLFLEYCLIRIKPNQVKLDPKSEKLQKLNLTLESYQKQYSEILEWERINKQTHQDRLMVTSMIDNVKDKIEKFSKKV
jgi:hypothetical protein